MEGIRSFFLRLLKLNTLYNIFTFLPNSLFFIYSDKKLENMHREVCGFVFESENTLCLLYIEVVLVHIIV